MNITKTFTKYKNKGFGVRNAGAKLIIMLALFLLPNITYATSLNEQIQQLQTKVDQTKTQVNSLSQVVSSIDSQISGLQGQINTTNQQISQTSADITKTEADLVVAQANLVKTRAQLSDIIMTSYMDSQQSQIEVIAKSSSFSEFVNRSEYLETVQVKVTQTAQQIVLLQQTLTQKKASLEADRKKSQDLKNSLVLQQNAIGEQRSVQASLLSQTKGSQAAFQQQLGSLVAYRKWLETPPPSSGGGAATGTVSYSGTGGYPWASYGQDSGADTWGFYYRECTSYAAWRSALSGAISSEMLRNWGTSHSANGGQWLGLAVDHGLSTSRTPRAGSVMVFPSSAVGGVGHVAFVDSVNGGTIDFSDYNWNLDGRYRHVSGANPYSWPLSSVTYIYQN